MIETETEFFKNGEQIGAQYRLIDIDPSRVDVDERTVCPSFSSETGTIQRERGVEILGHQRGEVKLQRLNNGAPLLLQHDQSKQIGVIDHASVRDGRGVALVRFSRSALGQEILQDVKDGIRTQVSVGYRVLEVSPPFRDEQGEVAYRATSWEPFEVSLVSVPFDESVGVGRAGENSTNAVRVLDPESAAPKQNSKEESRIMENTPPAPQEPTNEATPQPPSDTATRSLAPESAPQVIVPQKSQREIQLEESKRQVEIREIGEKFNMQGRAEDAIRNLTSAKDFSHSIAQEWNAPEEEIDTRGLNQSVGMDDKQVSEFSLSQCVRDMRNHGSLQGEAKEICDQAAINLGVQGKLRRHEFVAPAEVFRPSQRSIELREMRRDMDTATATNLGYMVQNEAPRYIERLENANILGSLGVNIIDGLSGDLPFNRKTGAQTGYWLGETESATESDISAGQLWMRPKRLVLRSVQSDQILMQTDGLSQRLIEDDMAEQEALAVQLAFFNGSGAGATPLGVNKQTGIGSITFGGAQTYADWLDMWDEVAQDNADMGGLAYVANSTTIKKGLSTAIESGDAQKILQAGSINSGANFSFLGIPIFQTNQAFDVASQLLYGSWNQALWGRWQARRIVVDEYTKLQAGQFVIQQSCYHDTNVRHVESFAASTDSAAQ